MSNHTLFHNRMRRKKALKCLKGYQPSFQEYIFKCAVYKNSTMSLNYWIRGLAEFLSVFTKLQKYGNLKAKDFINIIFENYSYDFDDCIALVSCLVLDVNLKRINLPDIDYKDWMAEHFMALHRQLENMFLSTLEDTYFSDTFRNNKPIEDKITWYHSIKAIFSEGN